MKRCFVIILSFFIFLICGCDNQSQIILAHVNGAPIYLEEIEYAMKQYSKKNTHISKKDILEYAICELLVLQQGDNLGIVIKDIAVKEKIRLLKNDYPELYNAAINDYGSEEKYKKALELHLRYEEIKESVIGEYILNNHICKDQILTLMREYGAIGVNQEEPSADLIRQFYSEYNIYRGEKFFSLWVENLRIIAEINYSETAYNQSYI